MFGSTISKEGQSEFLDHGGPWRDLVDLLDLLAPIGLKFVISFLARAIVESYQSKTVRLNW